MNNIERNSNTDCMDQNKSRFYDSNRQGSDVTDMIPTGSKVFNSESYDEIISAKNERCIANALNIASKYSAECIINIWDKILYFIISKLKRYIDCHYITSDILYYRQQDIIKILKNFIELDRNRYKNDKKFYYSLINHFDYDNIYEIIEYCTFDYDHDYNTYSIDKQDLYPHIIKRIYKLEEAIVEIKKQILDLLFESDKLSNYGGNIIDISDTINIDESDTSGELYKKIITIKRNRNYYDNTIISIIIEHGVEFVRNIWEKNSNDKLLYYIIYRLKGCYEFSDDLFDIISELIEYDKEFYKNDKQLYYLLLNNITFENIEEIVNSSVFQDNDFTYVYYIEESNIDYTVDELEELNKNIIRFKKRILDQLLG